MLTILEKWDNMAIDDKIWLIAIHTSYENVYVNHFNYITEICKIKFNDLPDIQYQKIKFIITMD